MKSTALHNNLLTILFVECHGPCDRGLGWGWLPGLVFYRYVAEHQRMFHVWLHFCWQWKRVIPQSGREAVRRRHRSGIYEFFVQAITR